MKLGKLRKLFKDIDDDYEVKISDLMNTDSRYEIEYISKIECLVNGSFEKRNEIELVVSKTRL